MVSGNGNADQSDQVKYNAEEDPKVDIKGKKKKDEKEEEPKLNYTQLFRYANSVDYLLMLLGTFSAVVHGVCMPCLFIVFGDITDPFVNYGKMVNSGNITAGCLDVNVTGGPTTMPLDINYFIMWFCIIAAITWISGTFQMHFWMLVAVRQGHRIKIKFLRSILRQDMTYFDLNSTGEMNTRLADDVQKIQDGIGDKLAVFICMMARTIAGIIIGFIFAWQLTLVILAVTPLMALSAGLLMKISTAFTAKELDAYAKAGAIAEEVLSSMRTVTAFGGEEKEVKRYTANLKEATKFGITKGVVTGLSLGFVMFLLFSVYGLSFWYGSTLVLSDPPVLSVGGLLTCFFAVFISAFSLGQGLSQAEYFSVSMGAGYKVFSLIDREPPIDSFSEQGHKPDQCAGTVEFENIDFTYPSREEVQVLKSVSFVAEQGKTVALCGQSGCGKSTCVQLIQRFYDPQGGTIKLDGHDIRTLNVKWLRDNIGVVSQEPVLFDTTIMENIRYGNYKATDDKIYTAAKEANAYDFIMKLPQKFETMVGEGGAQMSGGQKQRIAIARAIVRNPKVLLLDEATSALDTESESIVQAALEKASEGRTTIVIAHRLSTIRNADTIIGFHEGRALEQGSHKELLELDTGIYKNLVNLQNVTHVEEEESEEQKEITKCQSKRGSHRHHKRVLSGSHAADDESSIKSEDDDDDVPEVSWFRVMALNLPELHYIILGALASLVSGGVQPTYAIMFANFLGAFALTDIQEMKDTIRLYCLLFFALGWAVLISNFIQAACFAKSGEALTARIRERCFRHLMKMEIGYYDDHKNTTGALTTRLAVDASRVQGVAGVRTGIVCANFGALAVGLGIAFAYSWKLTLLMVAFLPFMVLGGYLQMQMITGQGTKESKSFEKAGSIATEATMCIRTVASLTKEDKFIERYVEALQFPYGKMKKKAFFYGLTFGYSQSVLNFAFAGVFRFGAYLVAEDCLPFDDMFRVLMAVMMAAMISGQSSSMAPDFAQAKLSSSRIFKLFDRESEIDSSNKDGDKPANYSGEETLHGCKFSYPTRPDFKVLKGLSVAVNSGETLALVGQSGCGKSTVIQLILRYYDTLDGEIKMDGKVNTATNIQWMRKQLGIVSQEPVLFGTTIAENIRYGDNTREVSLDEVIAAAKSANIHDFIETLPDKYETNVGGKGTQLSGGQKQRVAIARALVRKPKVLLLDEATSALDTESEKVVQAALDAAREGRTCIVIAHRLSTVRNADNIAVIENGAVVEFGKHSELLAKKGTYYNLVNAQLN